MMFALRPDLEADAALQEWEKRQAQWKSTLQKISSHAAGSRRYTRTYD